MDGREGRSLCTLDGKAVGSADAVASDEPGKEGAAGVGTAIVIPTRTVSGLNVREHWRARAARVRKERETTAWGLIGKTRPAVPCVVVLTRVGPSNGLDDDNLRGALKGVRDEIAKWLGVDDRSSLVLWAYAQRRGKQWAVEVNFE